MTEEDIAGHVHLLEHLGSEMSIAPDKELAKLVQSLPIGHKVPIEINEHVLVAVILSSEPLVIQYENLLSPYEVNNIAHLFDNCPAIQDDRPSINENKPQLIQNQWLQRAHNTESPLFKIEKRIHLLSGVPIEKIDGMSEILYKHTVGFFRQQSRSS